MFSDRSRLSPFERLPPIGVRVPHPPLGRRETPNIRLVHRNRCEEELIELAIHLPDGRRLVNRYSPSTRLRDVFESVCSKDFSLDEVYFSSADRPKRQFLDWNVNIRQAQIPSRSVLFLDRRDFS